MLGSRWFFLGIIILFVLQAVWIACSFRYSMIYDEYYHFGLIKYFSHQLLPWINNQPVSLDQYGALTRTPYLLYHYLLSFPFRLVSVVTNSLAVQVILMRFVNILLFGLGLVVFDRVFKEMKIKPILRNVTLLFFILLPIVPFVAATVNYDNLIFLLTAIFILLGIKIIKSPVAQWHQYALLVLVGMVGSLSKSAFPPIFAGGVLFIAGWLIYSKKKDFLSNIRQSYKASNIQLRLLILIPLVAVGLLFVERFGVNVVRYHSLDPSCTRLMTKDRCLADYTQLRSEDLKSSRHGSPEQFPQYAINWASTMVNTWFITGSNTQGKFGTKMAPPLPVIYTTAFLLIVVGTIAFFYKLDKLKQIPGFWFSLTIILLYLAALFWVNFSAYNEYYQAIAVQGRYLIPLLPLVTIFAVVALNEWFRNKKLWKLPVLLIVLIFYLNGAGLITHIVRSDDTWDWNNTTVRKLNDKTRSALRPFIKEWWYEK